MILCTYLSIRYRMDLVSAKHKDTKQSGGPLNIKRIDNSIYFSERITYHSAHVLQTLLKGLEIDILEDVEKGIHNIEKEKDSKRFITINVQPKPILLYLTTHGGLVHAALSVVDCMLGLKIPIYTIISGYVASAGTLISLAGSKRFMTPNSFMMVHEIRSGFWGKYSDARIEYENVTKLMEHITHYYLEKTKITKEKLSDMLRTDTDLTAKECLELGFVDVVSYSC